jgi:transcriptional regulator with XRE-family HTH domain
MTGAGRKLFAENMRALRTARKMSQEDLAGAAQIDRSYVSLIENEHFSISLDQIEKIADALGVEIREMFDPGRARDGKSASND